MHVQCCEWPTAARCNELTSIPTLTNSTFCENIDADNDTDGSNSTRSRDKVCDTDGAFIAATRCYGWCRGDLDSTARSCQQDSPSMLRMMTGMATVRPTATTTATAMVLTAMVMARYGRGDRWCGGWTDDPRGQLRRSVCLVAGASARTDRQTHAFRSRSAIASMAQASMTSVAARRVGPALRSVSVRSPLMKR